MDIAFVGCGFVADLYMANAQSHPHLRLVGAYDRDAERLTRFAARHGVRVYDSLEKLLQDPRVTLVVNLTNPASHFDVSSRALGAGKHVFSEKPLALSFEDGQSLVDQAERAGLQLAGAPSTLLSESAQTFWRALRNGVVGRPRLVYAEMEDGPVHRFAYRKWVSSSGLPWPYADEFATGCTLEHAGYCLTWLLAMFGPAVNVTAYSGLLAHELLPDVTPSAPAPNFSVALLSLQDGVVARMTCGLMAPHDHALRVFGDEGVLYTPETWSSHAPVYVRKWLTIRRKTLLSPYRRRLNLLRSGLPRPSSGGSQRIDFLRGVSELAEAIEQRRTCRLGARFSLHVTELALAIAGAGSAGGAYRPRSTFEPVEPMPWAGSRA